MWGSLLLVASGILAVAAWGGQRPLPVFAASETRAPRLPAGLPLAVGVILAVVLDALAAVQFLRHPEEAFGTTGWLWVSSIALLIAATASGSADQSRPPEIPANEAWGPSGGRLRDNPAELFVLAGLVALAFAARLWNLQMIPFAFDPDEFTALARDVQAELVVVKVTGATGAFLEQALRPSLRTAFRRFGMEKESGAVRRE